MKKVYLVEERTFDLQTGELMTSPSFIIYSSHKKASGEFEESKERWLKIGNYKVIENGLFPNEYTVMSDGILRKTISIIEEMVF